MLWVFLDFPLRLHHGERRDRDIEKTFLRRFPFGHLSATQQLTPREKLRFLPEDCLQERDGVTEIAQLDRSHRLEPVTALRFAQFFFRLNGHIYCRV